MMSAIRRCERCGIRLDPDEGHGICEYCLKAKRDKD